MERDSDASAGYLFSIPPEERTEHEESIVTRVKADVLRDFVVRSMSMGAHYASGLPSRVCKLLHDTIESPDLFLKFVIMSPMERENFFVDKVADTCKKEAERTATEAERGMKRVINVLETENESLKESLARAERQIEALNRSSALQSRPSESATKAASTKSFYDF